MYYIGIDIGTSSICGVIHDPATGATESVTRANRGYPVATGYGLVTHFHNLANGLVPAGAARLCTVMDYAAMRLAGRRSPLTDFSNAAALGLFDKRRLAFDTAALRKAGIDGGILPETGPSASLLGRYGGIPVYSAIGDNQAAYLGGVRERERAVHITVGTSSQISVYSPEYVEVETLDTRPLPGGGYLLVGAELCGGYAFSMLKDFFAETVRFICGTEVPDEALYAAMTSLPSLGDDASLRVDTLFDGTRQHPGKRGAITGISTSNLRPQALVAGFARGICEALYGYYRLLPPSLREARTHIVASGNGLRKNRLLREAFEERFGLPLVSSPHVEEAALGACLAAAGLHSYNTPRQ